MSKTTKIILDECLELFNMGIPEFSKFSDINYQTLTGWDKNKKVSPLGHIALDNIIKCKRLEDKQKDMDAMMEIIGKYTKPLI